MKKVGKGRKARKVVDGKRRQWSGGGRARRVRRDSGETRDYLIREGTLSF